jgi:signal transduction histidine kinase
VSETARPARWPWLFLAAFFAIAIVACVLVAANGESLAEQIPFVIAFSMFGVVGALILSRASGNRIGALLLYASCATAVGFLGGEVVTSLVDRGTTSGTAVVAAGVLSDLGWVIGILPALFLLPLLFPDGRLPSRRWRPWLWAIGAFAVLLAASILLGSEQLFGSNESVKIPNPMYLEGVSRYVEFSDAAVSVGLLVLIAGSFASLVIRFRRSRGVERQQIKWMVLAVLLLVVSLVVSTVLEALGVSAPWLDAVLSAPAFLAVPIAVGISVLQYRLYDLDIVVKKALVAGTLALFVVLVYGGVVGFFGLVASGGVDSGWVFAIALALGLAFRPVSKLARRVADRLVYGRRATPYEVLTEFSERVGDAYATEDVLQRMAQILGEGAGASAARVRLRIGGELRPVAAWPPNAAAEDGASPAQTTVEVRDKGELLGALSVEMPANDPMTPAKERLVNDLASQAGLVLRNVRLVEELRAAQRRLVTAQDHERRRLERNIHDGAQQQLVALSVKSRLAHGLVDRDPAKSQELLAQIGAELETALGDLRDLARGIYPPLLADKGLGSALEAQATRSPLPVRVEAGGVGRFAQELEAALYFSCLEALQNVAKYAEASSATVRLARDNGHVTFEVADDGRGFDPDATASGTGLQGMADRIAAVGGRLEVRSAPGTGTVIRGEVPVASEPASAGEGAAR